MRHAEPDSHHGSLADPDAARLGRSAGRSGTVCYSISYHIMPQYVMVYYMTLCSMIHIVCHKLSMLHYTTLQCQHSIRYDIKHIEILSIVVSILAQDKGGPSKGGFPNNRLFRKPPLLGPPLSLPEYCCYHDAGAPRASASRPSPRSPRSGCR